MPGVQEILGFVKNLRGQRGDPNHEPDRFGLGPLNGKCLSAMQVADQFSGQHWRSEMASGFDGQILPGHSVAVIPTRGTAGVVIDFTNHEQAVLGQVNDINNASEIAALLGHLTGYEGWYNRDEFDNQYWP